MINLACWEWGFPFPASWLKYIHVIFKNDSDTLIGIPNVNLAANPCQLVTINHIASCT